MRLKVFLPATLTLVGIIIFISLRLMHVQSQNLELRGRLEALDAKAPLGQTAENVNTNSDPEPVQLAQKQEYIKKLEQQLEQMQANTTVQVRVIAELSSEKQALASDAENLRGSPVKPVSGTRSPGTAAANTDGSVTYRENLDAWLCQNHLVQIWIAGKQWATAHDGIGPSSLTQLQDFLAPMTLVCPASKPKAMDAHWGPLANATIFDPTTITYRLYKEARFNRWERFVACPIHESMAWTDGNDARQGKYTTRWTGSTD